jgi:hypothetical protein
VSPYASAVAKAASEVALQLRSGDPSADEGEHSIFEFEEDGDLQEKLTFESGEEGDEA